MNLIIVGGFLGSGKTSLILSLAHFLVTNEDSAKTNLVIIENEVGEIGIDDKVLKSDGFSVKELFSGCVCCQLTSDLVTSLNDIQENINPKWITAIMSIVGDAGDDVPGVKGIGPGRSMELFSELDIVKKIIGTEEELRDRVNNNGLFFLEDRVPLKNLSKMWQKALIENQKVTDAYKLIDFEQLCLWLEKKDTLFKINMLKYIDDVLSKTGPKISNYQVLTKSLLSLEDNQLLEEDISRIF